MIIEECNLPYNNQFVNDYLRGDRDVKQLFDYDFTQREAYEKRMADLRTKTFPRAELVRFLLSFNEKYCSHPNVFDNIRKLESQHSVVVITGQQAGLLTGPIYTVYKAVSAIQLANRFEANLNIPVVPVFWVAGEDHDYQEINHVWAAENGVMKKHILKQKQLDKRPISNMPLDHDLLKIWLKGVFKSFGETDQTARLIRFVEEKARKSDGFSDFFIHLMAALFEEYGLVLIDSAHEDLRKIEAPFFETLVRNNEALQSSFRFQKENVRRLGYVSSVDSEEDCAHLFYHVNGERTLLFRNEDGTYYDKNHLIRFDEDELLERCRQRPEQFSNNVVTRPLMQDFLFPTLAFVAGPGEIAYWSHLKRCFQRFDRKMPPVVPRLHVTVVESHIKKILDRFGLPLNEVLRRGVESFKQEWLKAHQDEDVYEVIENTRHFIDLAHAKLRKAAWYTDRNLGKLSEKNRLMILSQIDFMKRRAELTFQERYAHELAALNEAGAALFPNEGWQERSWNVFYYLNKYGFSFIDRLFEIPVSNHQHQIMYV